MSGGKTELKLIMLVAFLGVGAVVGILILDPNNAGVIAAIIIGFLSTIVTGLFSAHKADQAATAAALAAAEIHATGLAVRSDIHDIHSEIQGRLTELVHATNALGIVEGRRQAEVKHDVEKQIRDG